jgi:hypothetical protein
MQIHRIILLNVLLAFAGFNCVGSSLHAGTNFDFMSIGYCSGSNESGDCFTNDIDPADDDQIAHASEDWSIFYAPGSKQGSPSCSLILNFHHLVWQPPKSS